MQDRNVICGSTAAVMSPLVDFYASLVPFIMLAVVLIFVDSRFGTLAAVKRGEQIRKSRKWRRAINKLVDYICWVTLAGFIGKTFGASFHIPILSVVMLCIVYGIELTSIFNNYFEYKGINKKFNAWKFFAKITGNKIIEDAVENIEDTNNENSNR